VYALRSRSHASSALACFRSANRCEQRTLAVFAVPPSSVKITGHEKAKAGERVTLTCTTSSSFPPARIIWLSRAQEVTSYKTYDITPSLYGGHAAVSNITVNLTREDDNAEYTCQATNPALGMTVVDSIQLQVNCESNRICNIREKLANS